MTSETTQFKSELQGVLEGLRRELSGIRTNRPSAGLLEDIRVPYYGQNLPIKQVGSVGVIPPREIHVTVWDQEAVAAVVKAIETSSVGLSPQVAGNVVKVFLPELSAERRQEFVKHVKKIVEENKIRVRHDRDEIMRKIKKMTEAGDLTEDDEFSEKEAIQKIVDGINKDMERLLDLKIKEIEE